MASPQQTTIGELRKWRRELTVRTILKRIEYHGQVWFIAVERCVGEDLAGCKMPLSQPYNSVGAGALRIHGRLSPILSTRKINLSKT